MKSSTITDVTQLPLMLNSEQMAELLGVNKKTLTAFLEANPTCPAFRMGDRGLIKAPRDALLNWINQLASSRATA